MASLTQKEEAFCLAYIELGSGPKAYREVYSCERMKDTTINRRAFDVLHRPHVESRLEELRAPVREKAQLTLEQHLNDLKRLRDAAEQSNQYSAAIAAEVNRGKASGLYVERIKHEDLPPPQIIINRPNGD